MDLTGAPKKFLDVDRGLFLIRYESADDMSAPPRLVISQEGWAPADLELVLPPDAEDPILWSPGASIVVRAARAGRIAVAVVPARSQGSTAAKVKLMSLSEDPLGSRPAQSLNLSEIRILGHLSGIGDVRVACNDWLGGPATPRRIEGFALEIPDLPSSVRLRYSARIGGGQPTTTALVNAGNFIGTRGRALPLLGLTLEMSGPGAPRYSLTSSALFLGSPIMRLSGQRIVLAGPTGREPLVGLQLSITEAEKSSVGVTEEWTGFEPETEAQGEAPAPSAAVRGSKSDGSVRVFRARTPQADAVAAKELPAATKGQENPVPAVSKSKVKVFSREHLKVNKE